MAGGEGSSKVTWGRMATVKSLDFILNVTEIHQVSKAIISICSVQNTVGEQEYSKGTE